MLEPQIIGLIGLAAMILLMFLRIPVAFAMLFVGFFGYWMISGLDSAFNILGNTFYSGLNNHSFTAVPLFILMGYFAYHCGIVTQVFDVAKKWTGHMTGGFAQASILGGAGFGAVAGSGFASTATLAKIAFPEMVKSGVDKRLAYGVIASAGPLAVMIPPSILMILFAIITQQSIGKLLIGGLLPGLLCAFIYMCTVYYLVRRNSELAPSIEKVPFSERVKSLKQVWSFGILIVVIVFGLYSGIFTPTEAGAIGAFVVLLMVLFMHGFNWKIIRDSILETIKTSCMVFLLIGGTFIFGYFMTITRIPTLLSNMLLSIPIKPIFILLGIIILYLILGCFLDMVSIMFITLPIVFPSIVALGFDPIWFGVLIVFVVEVSLITPPFGMSIFILRGSIPGSESKDIYIGVIPFVVANLIIIVLFMLFPQIITFLPSLM